MRPVHFAPSWHWAAPVLGADTTLGAVGDRHLDLDFVAGVGRGGAWTSLVKFAQASNAGSAPPTFPFRLTANGGSACQLLTQCST